jgi:cytidylate kinase
MKLTITGTPSSGKGVVSHILIKELNLKYYSIGNLKREAAAKRGLSLVEFNEWANNNPKEGHEMYDQMQAEIGRTEDNFIFDGRLSFYFIPDSFKIYLTCSMQKAAERRFLELQQSTARNEGDLHTLESVYDSIKARHESDQAHFIKQYDVDIHDSKNFDVVIDTTNLTPQETADEIIKHLPPQE